MFIYRILVIVYVLLSLDLEVHAQNGNLVPNHSFEDYTACPSGGGQLPLAFPWTRPTNLSSINKINLSDWF